MNNPNKPIADTMSVSLHQDSDCCADDQCGQSLTLRIADGGGGPYLVLETERWAVDSANDLYELLIQFESAYRRLGGRLISDKEDDNG